MAWTTKLREGDQVVITDTRAGEVVATVTRRRDKRTAVEAGQRYRLEVVRREELEAEPRASTAPPSPAQIEEHKARTARPRQSDDNERER